MGSQENRLRGGLLGLLVGDALGVPYEFHPAASLPPTPELEMAPPPTFPRSHSGVPPGTWSDDGAQALCLLESLLSVGALDIADLAQRFLRWAHQGHLAVDADVYDMGIQTRKALGALQSGVPANEAGPTGEYDNGNGSLMRVLPLALWHRGTDEDLIHDAMRSSLPTHGHARSQLCCALYCLWARQTLAGTGPESAWAQAAHIVGEALRCDEELVTELEGIEPSRAPGGTGSGYVVDCLHSTRGALLRTSSYEDAVRAAVALGNDTDTTAAVTGGIAGIVYGADSIPRRWRDGLRGQQILAPLMEGLLACHRTQGG